MHARHEVAVCGYCVDVSTLLLTSSNRSADILFDLVNEVKLDTSGWQPVDLVVFFVIIKFRVGPVRLIVEHFNDTIVAVPSAESCLGNDRILRLPNMDLAARGSVQGRNINLTQSLINMKRTHPVVDLLAIFIEGRRIRQRRTQAIQMPVLVAVVAGHNGTFRATNLV